MTELFTNAAKANGALIRSAEHRAPYRVTMVMKNTYVQKRRWRRR